MSNEVKLLPCPFCGGEAAYTRERKSIGCTSCWAEGPVTTSEGIAIEWNHRPTTLVTDEVVERDETGWLIEEDANGITHWIALAKDAWPRTTASTHPFASNRYKHPVERVKDANEALRFARKQDAEAFIKLFERFLLCAKATEHQWPLASMPTVVTGEQPDI